MIVWLAIAATIVATWADPIVLDDGVLDRRYDGHGGLSAGASSRLLFDYPEPQRSDVLDFLFKPSFGANLHICKVEIGGDVQSTDGSESSHMHTRYDINFERGYEWWLMAEAKKRNPDVLTYALSWGVPGWVGNGSFFSTDNVYYQVAFVRGARDTYNITIDYLGIWNERSWGNPDYVLALRQALDAAGLPTRIVGADGGIPQDQIAALAANQAFSRAEPILGRHYPCASPEPPAFWNLSPKKTFWANEDYSTVADWAGAGCWGRSLNQNYVKLNATSTIAWSTLWSVYETWPYWGNGLMYAFWPSSGYYQVKSPIWTSAHTTQFVQPGWFYLGGSGRGLLPGGGSWVAMVPPEDSQPNSKGPLGATVKEAGKGDFTLVIEKLDGACLRCQVPASRAETLSFALRGNLQQIRALHVWLTNSTHWFIQLPDILVTSGLFTVVMPADTILTLTTTIGQRKGSASPPPQPAPFPLPYTEHYNTRPAPQPARYHADSSGAFEIFEANATTVTHAHKNVHVGARVSKGKEETVSVSTGESEGVDVNVKNQGGVLRQMQPLYPRGTEWNPNYDPITSLGSVSWADVTVMVDVNILAPARQVELQDQAIFFPDTLSGLHSAANVRDDPISNGAYAGVCVRQRDQWDSGYCLLVGAGLKGVLSAKGWVLQAGSGAGLRVAGSILAHGSLPAGFNLTGWQRLSLGAVGPTLTAGLNGAVLATVNNSQYVSGLVSLRSGYHFAQFDNLHISGQTPPSNTLFDTIYASSCNRRDFTGPVGAAVIASTSFHITSLGRFGATTRTHTLSVVDGTTLKTLATVQAAPSSATDAYGFIYTPLATPLAVLPGQTIFILSDETLGGDVFCDHTSTATARPSIAVDVISVYYYQGTWFRVNPGAIYGPVNALVTVP